VPVRVAESGEGPQPGIAYLGPDGMQMGISGERRIRLTNEVTDDGFAPSASYLFRSIADAYGPSAAGIILTGMGRDGAGGLLRLRQAGGITIAQDEASSVVFGMPGEAVRLGAVEYVLSPGQIAAFLRGAATQQGGKRASPLGD
jgi:two-component system chemotaxis response regulator CheB